MSVEYTWVCDLLASWEGRPPADLNALLAEISTPAPIHPRPNPQPAHITHAPHRSEAWGVAEGPCLECDSIEHDGTPYLTMLIREAESDGGHLSVACEMCGWAGPQDGYTLADPRAQSGLVRSYLLGGLRFFIGADETYAQDSTGEWEQIRDNAAPWGGGAE